MKFPLPNLFIPGVQKAGTTALSSFLSQHPDICLVKGKEAHVFDDPEYHRANNKLEYARTKYASKLAHYNGERYILDATPITMLHPEFIRAAAITCPDAKYIVMLRDPIERALSHYAMTKSRGLEPHSPTKAFLLEPWRMRGFFKELPLAPFESKYRDQSYLIRGTYKRQLKALRYHIEDKNLFVARQSDLNIEHQETLHHIFSFLDIPTIKVQKQSVFKTSKEYVLPKLTEACLRTFFNLFI